MPGSATSLDAWRRTAQRRLAEWGEYLAGVPEPHAPGGAAGWLRPKGNISRGLLAVLLALGLLPILSMLLRISAVPGVLDPGAAGTLLPSIGQDLTQFFSLRDVPPEDRDRVLYVLSVPIGAVLIALARFTFGIKVIGFRAILIAVGFLHSGILPTLLLIGVMVLVVASIRPALLRMRLPYLARVAVIMCTAVVVLLVALMLAPGFRSDTLWSVAFFPVIVLGLLAEGVAKTVDRASFLAAFWRTGMTILIALLLALIFRIPVLREIAIEFPELVVTQIVLIILIAEYLDLRLLQDWDARLTGMAPRGLFGGAATRLRIAVVHNRGASGVIGSLGAPSRGRYRRRTVRGIAQTLRDRGHTVETFEGDMSLLAGLQDFLGPDALSGQPGGIVLNLAHGIQGDLAAAHVPAMLEMAGVPYVGPAPGGVAGIADLVVLRRLLRATGVETPDGRLVASPQDPLAGLLYPVVVRPRYNAGRTARVARNRGQLDETVARLVRRTGQPVIVEPVLPGREIDVPLLGNAPTRCLPLVEILADGAQLACPAALDPGLATAVRSAALAAFNVAGCRDYAVVNLRVDDAGRVVVQHVLTGAVLEPDESFAVSTAALGMSYGDTLEALIAVARDRYRSAPGDRSLVPVTGSEAPGPAGDAALAR